MLVFLIVTPAALFSQAPPSRGFVPTTLNDVFFPGSQPGESGTFATPDQCSNCHSIAGEQDTEIPFNWRGSMMSQAQRDPLYLACLTIANQDAPDVGDLCIRCHSPTGWLEGRSTPTDGSALTADDRQSVQCTFCHRMIAPTTPGINPYPDDPLYVTGPGNNPSTYTLDQNYLATITHYPPGSGNGAFICDDQDTRRGPLYDPQANHEVPYSPFHPDAALCGTCHDVSNPVYSTVRDPDGNILGYAPNAWDSMAPDFNTYEMFPIERTYSEWRFSAYNSPTGIPGTAFGGNKTYVATCQDCHMKDVTGKACNKNYAPTHTDLPLHDMTGGNTFIPYLIDQVFPGEADVAALMAGVSRARWMLQHAASMDLAYNPANGQATVTVTNETGHKLPSGYPEGRRIWIHLKATCSWSGEAYESGAYDTTTAILDTAGAKIYEIHPGLSPGLAASLGLPPGKSFHFVLNDTIYFDNRIPPRGFTNANFDSIQSPPVGYAYADGQYWDNTVYQVPFEADEITVTLYYQTTSKEYVEFLRDENVTDSNGVIMYNLWAANGKSTPEEMVSAQWSRVTRWTGSIDTDWNNPGNWDNGVPSDQFNAVVPSNAPVFPVITTSAYCDHIIVHNGVELIVASGGSLTIGSQATDWNGEAPNVRRVFGGKVIQNR